MSSLDHLCSASLSPVKSCTCEVDAKTKCCNSSTQTCVSMLFLRAAVDVAWNLCGTLASPTNPHCCNYLENEQKRGLQALKPSRVDFKTPSDRNLPFSELPSAGMGSTTLSDLTLLYLNSSTLDVLRGSGPESVLTMQRTRVAKMVLWVLYFDHYLHIFAL